LTDFRPDIHTNLSFYRGIVEDQARIETLNTILNELQALGFGKLVQNFSTQRDPERASDILFEISICQLLRRNVDVQNLQYEPLGEEHPPDFRFQLHGVSFDLQVKQLHNRHYQDLKCILPHDQSPSEGGAYAKRRGGHHTCREFTGDDRINRPRIPGASSAF
jgi:hypothetical protein